MSFDVGELPLVVRRTKGTSQMQLAGILFMIEKGQANVSRSRSILDAHNGTMCPPVTNRDGISRSPVIRFDGRVYEWDDKNSDALHSSVGRIMTFTTYSTRTTALSVSRHVPLSCV